MAAATLAADGGLSDITSLLALVKDQKTTSSTSTNLSAAGVQQQINEILGGNAGLASVAGGQRSAGFYNSTVNTQLVNDLLTRTAATVAARNATTTTTQSKKASLSPTQAVTAALALASKAKAAKSLYDTGSKYLGKVFGSDDTLSSDQVAEASKGLGDLGGSTASDAGSVGESIGTEGPASSNLSNVLGSAFDEAGYTSDSADVLSAGLSANDAASTAALDAGGADAGLSSVDAASAAGLAGGSAELGSDAALAGAATEGSAVDAASLSALEAGGEGAAGAAEGIGAGTIGLIGAAAIPLIGGAIKAYKSGDLNDIGDVYGQFGHWAGDRLQSTGDGIRDVADAVTDGLGDLGNSVAKDTGWIVCTELLRQGKFNRKHYVAGLKVFQSYPAHLLCGYYLWANPLVSYIRRNPDSWITSVAQHLFSQRAEYLAARSGVSGARDTVYGQSISALMFGFCWVLGQALCFVNSKKGATYGRT